MKELRQIDCDCNYNTPKEWEVTKRQLIHTFHRCKKCSSRGWYFDPQDLTNYIPFCDTGFKLSVFILCLVITTYSSKMYANERPQIFVNLQHSVKTCIKRANYCERANKTIGFFLGKVDCGKIFNQCHISEAKKLGLEVTSNE